jgi:hypothetical protein
MGWTCGMHGGWERCLQGFGWGSRREEALVRQRRRWGLTLRRALGR